jgi:hypothetical protein
VLSGDLASAVHEAEKIAQENSRQLISDWLQAAKARLEVEQALQVLRDYTSLQHAGYA